MQTKWTSHKDCLQHPHKPNETLDERDKCRIALIKSLSKAQLAVLEKLVNVLSSDVWHTTQRGDPLRTATLEGFRAGLTADELALLDDTLPRLAALE